MQKYFWRISLTVLVAMLAGSCSMVSTKKKATLEKGEDAIKVIHSMTEISDLIPLADLVIFDIDHTILEAKTPYCHSNWFYDLFEEAVAQGISEKSANDALLPQWEESQKNCEVKAVEAFVPKLINDMQASGKKVMALTSRSKDIKNETIAQLTSLGIDFSASAPLSEDIAMDLGYPVVSKNGVVFVTEYLGKGIVIKEYLKRAAFNPRRVLFIDDSMRNLKSVHQVLTSDGIKVDAFHYPLVKRSMPDWNLAHAKSEFEKRHGKIVYR